jgi:hypothetical protein
MQNHNDRDAGEEMQISFIAYVRDAEFHAEKRSVSW